MRARIGERIIVVDRGVNQWNRRMGGQPCLVGHRLPMTILKRLSRKDMKEMYSLTEAEIETVIRYWKVRGFEKVR